MGNDDFRERFKAVRRKQESGDDLFKLWDDQKQMQAEDKRLQAELKAAKKKAKELRRTLVQHQIGEGGQKLHDTAGKVTSFAKKRTSGVREKVRKLSKRQKAAFLLSGSFILVAGGLWLGPFRTTPTGTLGDSTIPIAEQDLPREKPEFKLLYPAGSDASRYDTVRISPPEAAASYTYLDRFTDGSQIFRVTQQEIPENFDVAKVATDFQATSIIQIDDTTVYHGYSEKGGIQSLIFVKNNNLVSIRSPQKFKDDQWASYIASLQ